MKCTPYALALISRTADRSKKAYQAAVDGKGVERTAACVSGEAVVVFNPGAPEQDMLAASIVLPSVQGLLAWCGWDRAQVFPVQKVVASWQWRGLQKLTFALARHEWYDDTGGGNSGPPLTESLSPQDLFLPDATTTLRSVPEGIAASGTLKVLGEWVPATLVSSRVDETFRLTAVLPGPFRFLRTLA